MDNQTLRLTDIIADMFLRYPAASKTSVEQVRVYVSDLSEWPASMVARAIGEVRANRKRKREFPPSCDEVLAALQSLSMSMSEQHELCRLRGGPQPIERARPEPVRQRESPVMTDVERAAMRGRIRAQLQGLGCSTEGWDAH